MVLYDGRFQKSSEVHGNVALCVSQAYPVTENLTASLLGAARGLM